MNVIITGGTKGLGRAIADSLASQGANLAICARSQANLDDMASTLQASYPEQTIYTHRCDVSKSDQVRTFGQEILSRWETIDVLINNAGVFRPGLLLEEDEQNLSHQIETNLYSAYHLTRLIAPRMVEQKSGHIFNMCSVASLIALPNGGSYSISKFALLGFSKVLREELKTHGIKVTSIIPGATWSDSWAGVELPEERLMQATDIAIAVSAAIQMSPSAVVEDIVLRPQLGDL
ncbi:MAG: SDR family oxidoreductase [Bacteroidota bacterium]